MKPSHRKRRNTEEPSFYGVLIDEAGRLAWGCGHDHPDRRGARRCAKRFARQGAAGEPPARPRGRRGRPVPTAAGAKPRLSRTTIEKLISCAVYEPDSGENAAFGSVVHDAIHTYFRACIAAGEESRWGDVDRITNEAFYRTPRGLHPSRLDEVRDLVDRFARRHDANLDALWRYQGEPALEVEFTVDVGWATFSCRMDRIDRIDGDDPDDPPRALEVQDYKSGWAPSDHIFQGRFYVQTLFLTIPTLEEVLWRPDAIRVGEERQVDPFSYQRGDLDEWWEGVVWGAKQRWELRQSGLARPTGGAACEYCRLRYTCASALSVARELPENMDQAEEVFMEFMRLSQARSLRREALALFFKDRLPGQIGPFEVGWLTPKEPSWKASDPLAIVNHMNAVGLDGSVALFTAIDPKKVPKELKPELVEKGAARYEPGRRTFKVRKAGSNEEADEG